MTTTQKKTLATIVTRLSRATDLDEAIIVHFIIAELERLYHEGVRVHESRLSLLENEIQKRVQAERGIVASVRRKEEAFRVAAARLEKANATLDSKSAALTETLQELEVLRLKLAELDATLARANKDRAEVQYSFMMKSHRSRGQTDTAERINRWILAIFTLIAVAIATYLVWR